MLTYSYLKYGIVRMALHLVGETLDKTRSHYRAETGKLVQLMRGIYVDADDDVDATVLGHAVRIARYLYPQAYLSAASATLLGPTRDGRLFISARRKQRTRIRALEIIQTKRRNIHPSVRPSLMTVWANSTSVFLRCASGSSRHSGNVANTRLRSIWIC